MKRDDLPETTATSKGRKEGLTEDVGEADSKQFCS